MNTRKRYRIVSPNSQEQPALSAAWPALPSYCNMSIFHALAFGNYIDTTRALPSIPRNISRYNFRATSYTYERHHLIAGATGK